MRKLTVALAALAALGGTALVAPANAAPMQPSGIAAPDAPITAVQGRMERRMMRHRMERRMMRHRMERRMMRHRVERRMMRRGM